MQINKNNNEGKEIEITVELSTEELKPHLEEATKHISKDTKVEGFRPGHAPYEVLKNQVGEMTIIQEAANLAIQKTANDVIKENVKEEVNKIIGRPEIKLTKVAAGNPLEYKIILQLMPEVKLGKYKELGVKQNEVKVKDEEAEKVIQDLLNMRASEKLVDREIKDGDKAAINIQMFLDKVPLEGGQSQNTSVIIGEDYIVPGFGNKLIGAKSKEAREFTLEYPKDHYHKAIAGKMVEFKVEIKGVYEREAPKLDDAFAKTLGAKDVDDIKANIKKNLEQEQKQKSEQKAVMEVFDKLLAATAFSHVPTTMIDSEAHNMVHELKHNVEHQGGKFEDYLTHIKKSAEELEQDFRPEAEKRMKISLIISEISKQEELKVTKEELEKKIEDSLKAYKNNPEFKKKSDTPEFRNYLEYNMLNEKVIGKLKEWNIS